MSNATIEWMSKYRKVLEEASDRLGINAHEMTPTKKFRDISADTINNELHAMFNEGVLYGRAAIEQKNSDLVTMINESRPDYQHKLIEEFVDQQADRTPTYLKGKARDVIEGMHAAFSIGMVCGTIGYAMTKPFNYEAVVSHMNYQGI